MLRSHVIKAIPSLILGLIGNVRERRRRYQNSSSSTIVSIRNESPHYSASSTPDKYRQFRTSPGRLRRATTTICSTANVYCSLDRAEPFEHVPFAKRCRKRGQIYRAYACIFRIDSTSSFAETISFLPSNSLNIDKRFTIRPETIMEYS